MGCTLEFDWPWQINNRALQTRYPRSMRDQLERDKTPILWMMVLYATDGTARVEGRDVTMTAFAGALPYGLALGDTREMVARKLGGAGNAYKTFFAISDKKTNRDLHVHVKDRAPQKVETLTLKVHIEPEDD